MRGRFITNYTSDEMISSETPNRDFLSYFIFSVFLIAIILKDFFTIISFYIPVNLNYVLSPIIVIAFLRYGLSYWFGKKYLITLLPMFFFLWIFIYFAFYFMLSNNYQYSHAQMFIILTFHSVLPIVLLLTVSNNPALFIFLIKKFLFFTGLLTLTVSYLVLALLIIDRDFIIELFSDLMNAGVIVNPMQTSESSVELRFSSIFSSAYVLALFCNTMIAFALFYINHRFLKTMALLLIIPILFLTLNRNGLLISIFIFSSYFFYKISKKLFVYWTLAAVLFIFILILITPLATHLAQELGGFGIEETALTKLSTLNSRVNAWSEFLNINNLHNIFFGMGFVQGIAVTKFFIDNGFYYLLAQTGIGGSLLFYILICHNLKQQVKNVIEHKGSDSCLALLLFSAGFVSMFLNNSFFEPIYLLFYFAFPIAVTILNKRSNSSKAEYKREE
jgi:hypothetical protein